MNILNPIGPVVIPLTLPWPGTTVVIPVSIKPGYLGKSGIFKFNLTLETDLPADMGGNAGLFSADWLRG